MAKRKRKVVDILDVECFEKGKAAVEKACEHLGRGGKLTDSKALRVLVNAGTTMYGGSSKMLLVDWEAVQSHIFSTGERLADQIIEGHVRGMNEFLSMEISVKRVGRVYSFECKTDKGTLHLVYDASEHVTKEAAPS